jgi:hypothetical protein
MTQGPENFGLDELLADSVVRATMRADGVEPAALESLMKTVARSINSRRVGFAVAKSAPIAKTASLPPDALAVPFARGTLPFAGDFAPPRGLRDCCAPCW